MELEPERPPEGSPERSPERPPEGSPERPPERPEEPLPEPPLVLEPERPPERPEEPPPDYPLQRPAGPRTAWLVVIAAGLLLMAALSLVPGLRSCAPRRPARPGEPPPRASTREEIQKLLDAGVLALGVPDTTGADSTWTWVKAYYVQRGGGPVWSGHQPHREVGELVGTLEKIGEAGLDPGDYGTGELTRLLAQAMGGGLAAVFNRERTLARLDVRATYAALRVAPHLRDGHIARGLLDPDWTPRSRMTDWITYLHESIQHDPAHALADLEPRHEGYRRLRQSLDRYRAIAAAGGWPQIPEGPPLKEGDRDRRVGILVRRLALTGDLEPRAGALRDTVFDKWLVHTIGELQTRWGVPRSGVVGEATRALLNVPVERRIRQIELNLERWRWLPDDLGDRHVEINIPAYRLELVDHGRVARAMRVVVGRKRSPTPIFSDALAYVDVNPTWTLPPSVVQKEIVPTLKRDPGFLAANRMHVVSIADARRDTVNPAQVDWKRALSDSFLYLIVQEAGLDNPLGRVKIMCPNEYDVYLHDSPQRSRFSVAQRDYSHGCVRVEEAVELADSLLGVPPTDSLFIDSLATRSAFRRVRLTRPVPVHFLYWTAWTDSAGHVCFRDDLYGLDQRLDQALRERTTARFELNPGVAVSAFWLDAEKRRRELVEKLAAEKAPRRK